jgi:GntR family transcriptional regulator, arabinose operon transcriptional repressor
LLPYFSREATRQKIREIFCSATVKDRICWYSVLENWYTFGAEKERVSPLTTYLYREIATALRGRIERGEFAQGRLPSERSLTDEFKVQRATVRRALKTLETEGLIFRDTTRGTFARPKDAPKTENGSIALIVGRATDTAAIARGLAQVIRNTERFLVWYDSPAALGHTESEIPDPNELLARGVAACALWPRVPASIERLRALRDALPLVLLDRRVPGFESDFIGINDVAAGQQITEHLLRVGHRRIGFVGNYPHVGTVQDRYLGWTAALTDAGIRPPEEWAFLKHGDIGEEDDAAFENLVAANGSPLTALVCGNDSIAAQAIRFANMTGRRLGIDLSVTGFGNAFPALLDAVGLTTVAQPFEEMGRRAGERLLDRLRAEADVDERSFQEEVLPVSLVIRRSCGTGTFGVPVVSSGVSL